MKNKYGFTLIEIMIALTILAIIGSITVVGLHITFRTQETINQKSRRLAAAQEAVIIIERDLLQIINRPVIDSYGTLLPAVMVRYSGGRLSLEFTRAGFINPFASQNRTTLQRVNYAWDGKSLLRTTWQVLDRAPGTLPETQILLSDVSSFDVRFLDITNQFSIPGETPVPSAQEVRQLPLPLAVELNLDVEGLGKITRVISLGVKHEERFT